MQKVAFRDARILVVNDEPVNVRILTHILAGHGYTNVVGLTDPRDVFALVTPHEPDLILLDLMMPGLSGFDVMTGLGRLTPPGTMLPFLILTADVTPEVRQRALTGEAM